MQQPVYTGNSIIQLQNAAVISHHGARGREGLLWYCRRQAPWERVPARFKGKKERGMMEGWKVREKKGKRETPPSFPVYIPSMMTSEGGQLGPCLLHATSLCSEVRAAFSEKDLALCALQAPSPNPVMPVAHLGRPSKYFGLHDGPRPPQPSMMFCLRVNREFATCDFFDLTKKQMLVFMS